MQEHMKDICKCCQASKMFELINKAAKSTYQRVASLVACVKIFLVLCMILILILIRLSSCRVVRYWYWTPDGGSWQLHPMRANIVHLFLAKQCECVVLLDLLCIYKHRLRVLCVIQSSKA